MLRKMVHPMQPVTEKVRLMPDHNGAGQNRKQDLTFSSQEGQIRTAACPAEPGTVYPASGPSLVLAQRPTGC